MQITILNKKNCINYQFEIENRSNKKTSLSVSLISILER